jgi:hypothetical protein
VSFYSGIIQDLARFWIYGRIDIYSQKQYLAFDFEVIDG